MITKEQIPAVLDHPVYDTEGTKIGDAKHVFLDDVTGKPDWVTVRTGLFGMSESFVPVQDARLVQDHLEVPFSKSKVKDAPHVDVDSGGHLSVDEERKLYRHYGMEWGETGRRAGQGTAGTGTGTAGAAGDRSRMGEPYPGAAMGTRGTEGTGKGVDTGTRPAMTADEAAAAAETDVTGTRVGRPTEGRQRGREDLEAERAVTRYEEELHVGVEQTEAGRARLHRYVDTEHVERTVPLRHEELLIEREPITEANRGTVTGGHKIGETEEEVVLHRERAVLRTEVVPKERVRLRVEERTTEEVVGGDVRRERIEIETDEGRLDTRGTSGDVGRRRGRGTAGEYGPDYGKRGPGEPGMDDYGRGGPTR
ncbi:YsnF/AvaK domain-containing protein [Streptomyces pactum]|uniref:YsnF/AvaK domain-containing protein n=1 Tax=Streptomyces pactum TaxID=68249 RepID=A0ABS0NS02_9ACTN|nr:PRC and DUF2382 domain-containing protein [Streptomyces pactum]MBH5337994.1 YsnF/AvaK domain-containing protein [Streptomyces pactum]